MPWWCTKGSPFWHRGQCSTKTSESGYAKPTTRRYGHTTRFFHQAHWDQRRVVTTAGKRGYTGAVKNTYVVPSPPTEEHHGAINDLHTMVQGIQTQSYDLEILAQSNAVLTRSNSAVIAQLAQMTVTMNSVQAQLKTLASAQTNQTRANRKYHCWSFGSNYNHGIKN